MLTSEGIWMLFDICNWFSANQWYSRLCWWSKVWTQFFFFPRITLSSLKIAISKRKKTTFSAFRSIWVEFKENPWNKSIWFSEWNVLIWKLDSLRCGTASSGASDCCIRDTNYAVTQLQWTSRLCCLLYCRRSFCYCCCRCHTYTHTHQPTKIKAFTKHTLIFI